MSLKENATYWDKRSGIFDGQNAKIYEDAYKKTIKYTLNYVKKEDHILDIGCGTGITTFPIAEQAGRITAVDTSPEMVNTMKKKAEQSGTLNIEILQGDLSMEELRPETFDLITAFNVLLYLPDQDGAMERIRQLIKPGGYLAVAADCLKFSCTKEAAQKWWRSRTGEMPYVKFYTPKELEQLASHHGFSVLESEALFARPVNHFFIARREN